MIQFKMSILFVCYTHEHVPLSEGERERRERERERDDGEAAERAGSSSLLCEVAGSCCSLSFCLFSLLLWEGTAKDSYLVDPASSHMLVSKIKPCMSKYKQIIQ